MFLSMGCRASPTTMPAAPAEGQQADAVLRDAVEGHQRRSDANDDDQRHRDALEDAALGDVLAGQQVVCGIELEAPQVERHPDMERRAGADHRQRNETKEEGMANHVCLPHGERRGQGSEPEEHDDQRKAERSVGALDQGPPEHVATRGDARQQPCENGVGDHGHDQSKREDEDGDQPVRQPCGRHPEALRGAVDYLHASLHSCGDKAPSVRAFPPPRPWRPCAKLKARAARRQSRGNSVTGAAVVVP